MIVSPDALLVLKKHFKFDRMFNLIEYDLCMEKLLEELKPLVKDEFEHNYRFIFLHYDTDYHISTDFPGITLINLQRILVSLDIPNYFCIILTQQDLTEQLEYLRVTETTDTIPIMAIKTLTHVQLYSDTNANLDINILKIYKKFISLNGIPRFHRRIIASGLLHSFSAQDGFISYNKKNKS